MAGCSEAPTIEPNTSLLLRDIGLDCANVKHNRYMYTSWLAKISVTDSCICVGDTEFLQLLWHTVREIIHFLNPLILSPGSRGQSGRWFSLLFYIIKWMTLLFFIVKNIVFSIHMFTQYTGISQRLLVPPLGFGCWRPQTVLLPNQPKTFAMLVAEKANRCHQSQKTC